MKFAVIKFLLWGALGFAAAAFVTDKVARAVGVRGALMGTEYRTRVLMAYGMLEESPDVVVVGSSRIADGPNAGVVEDVLRQLQGIDVDVYELGIAGLRVEWLRHLFATSFEDVPPKKLLVLAVEARFFAFGQSIRDAGGEAEPLQGEWDEDIPRPLAEEAFGGLRDIYALERLLHDEVQDVIELRHANHGEFGTLMSQAAAQKKKLTNALAAARRQGLDAIPDHLADGSIRWSWPDRDSQTMQAWWEILDRAEQLDCEVVFIRMPLAPGFDEWAMPEITPLFQRDVVDEVRARGFDFLDLQGPGWNDDPDWFYSSTHLATAGVRPFSRRFAEEILAPYLR